jgi:hypothetical protein
MMHFTNELQRFIYYEVIECAWEEFVNTEFADLDKLLNAHDKYLNSITKKGLIATPETLVINIIDLEIFNVAEQNIRNNISIR